MGLFHDFFQEMFEIIRNWESYECMNEVMKLKIRRQAHGTKFRLEWK